MRQGREKLQSEDCAADLKYGSMEQRRVSISAVAGYGNTVDEHLAAEAWTNQQAGSVLPGKIQMLRTDARTGNH